MILAKTCFIFILVMLHSTKYCFYFFKCFNINYCFIFTKAPSAKSKLCLVLPGYIPEVFMLWQREVSILPKLPKLPLQSGGQVRSTATVGDRTITRSKVESSRASEEVGLSDVAGQKLKRGQWCPRVTYPPPPPQLNQHIQVLFCPIVWPVLAPGANELLALSSRGDGHAQLTWHMHMHSFFFFQNLTCLFCIVDVVIS